MDWRLKAHTLAFLSRVPGGKRLYQALQYWAGTDRTGHDEYLSRALDLVRLIRESGHELRGSTVVEVGTGWKPFLPFTLSLLGAERVITLDVNPWLNATYAFQTAQALSERLHAVAGQSGAGERDVERRFRAAMAGATNLANLLKGFRVTSLSPADARRTGLATGTVDYVVSSNVLEHIPEDVLREIHRESWRVLRPGGLVVHRFNPEDHFSEVDPSITSVNFLRFSSRKWRWYGGRGLAYHNRLRCVQHQRLFEEASFELLTCRVRVNERALQAILSGEVPIHPDFQHFSPEELAADYMWIVGRHRDLVSTGSPWAGSHVSG